MKWCLVAAGLKDLSRPAEKLSVSQNVGTYNYIYGEKIMLLRTRSIS